jgi:hypothetical protein
MYHSLSNDHRCQPNRYRMTSSQIVSANRAAICSCAKRPDIETPRGTEISGGWTPQTLSDIFRSDVDGPDFVRMSIGLDAARDLLYRVLCARAGW